MAPRGPPPAPGNIGGGGMPRPIPGRGGGGGRDEGAEAAAPGERGTAPPRFRASFSLSSL
jgi:hypothetical protein